MVCPCRRTRVPKSPMAALARDPGVVGAQHPHRGPRRPPGGTARSPAVCASPTWSTGATPAAAARASTRATWPVSSSAWVTRWRCSPGSRGPCSTTAWASPRCPGSTCTATPTPSGYRTPVSSTRRRRPARVRGHVHGRASPSPGPSPSGPGACWRPGAASSTSSTTTSASARGCSGCSKTGGRCSRRCITPSPSTACWPCRTPRTPTGVSPSGGGSGSWGCRCAWRGSCRAS